MNGWTILGNLSNAVAAGLAAFSIYITIKEQKNIRKNDRIKTIEEQDLNWYNTVVLEDFGKQLTGFINESEMILEHCKKVDDKDVLVRELENAYNCIKEKFKALSTRALLLKIFSDSLYRRCDESMQKILDLYCEIINEVAVKKYWQNRRERDIQDERVKMIKQLYLFKSNFISGVRL